MNIFVRSDNLAEISTAAEAGLADGILYAGSGDEQHDPTELSAIVAEFALPVCVAIWPIRVVRAAEPRCESRDDPAPTRRPHTPTRDGRRGRNSAFVRCHQSTRGRARCHDQIGAGEQGRASAHARRAGTGISDDR